MNVAFKLKEFFLHNRWVTKHQNGVSNVLDIVKAWLRRIANSIDLEELKKISQVSQGMGVFWKKVKIMV